MTNDLIAERTFKIIGSDASVTAQVLVPYRDGDDYKCIYRIAWPDKIFEGYVFGVDSLQAVILAVQHMSADLQASSFAQDGKLYWLEPNNGLGLSQSH
jgi:hypothetical protein